ncbi:hypothetical protein [Paenibacillus thiaminolyticus]|uniref:hypothetical protein n=1 Tax=Paenibacillus thiaminolyticus TaxID=49283 RepID=UPI003B97F6F0
MFTRYYRGLSTDRAAEGSGLGWRSRDNWPKRMAARWRQAASRAEERSFYYLFLVRSIENIVLSHRMPS